MSGLISPALTKHNTTTSLRQGASESNLKALTRSYLKRAQRHTDARDAKREPLLVGIYTLVGPIVHDVTLDLQLALQ